MSTNQNNSGILEISHDVRAWNDGGAEFDYTVCGEYVIKDTDGQVKYAQLTNLPTGEAIYIVSKYSAFDEQHYFDSDYVIEHYEDMEECQSSRYSAYFEKLEELTDKKYQEQLAYIDDTRNYPNGRSCVTFGDGNYAEWYSKELGKYLQIRKHSDTTIYSVSDISYYLRHYMGEMYAYYYPKAYPEEYIEEVNSLDEFSWDSPYIFLFTQYRGLSEIYNRRAMSRFTKRDKESVNYKDGYLPIFASAVAANIDTRSAQFTAVIVLVDDNNNRWYIYTTNFVEANVIEYVATPISIFSNSQDYKRDASKDIVFKSFEVAAKSEWREYFILLKKLREMREARNIDIVWRTGDEDKLGVYEPHRQPLDDNEYTLWSEEISQGQYDKPEEWVFGFEGKHLHIIDIVMANSNEASLLEWIRKEHIDEYKKDEHKKEDYLVRKGLQYYHLCSNKGYPPSE